MKYVALLRGINVGGNNKLPMKDLMAMFTEAGCSEVKNYIQSGNVVFSSKATGKLAGVICASIEKQFGFQTTVILRNVAEMEKIAASNPYADVEHSHVVFLASAPTGDQVGQLDPKRSAPDEFKVVGKEVYLYLPNGGGQTKLSNAYFDSKLKTVSTVRNWRTCLKLLAMMAG